MFVDAGVQKPQTSAFTGREPKASLYRYSYNRPTTEIVTRQKQELCLATKAKHHSILNDDTEKTPPTQEDSGQILDFLQMTQNHRFAPI